MLYKKHIPYHVYLDETIYSITVGTLYKKRLFDSKEKKDLIETRLHTAVDRYNAELHAWVILSNHYHILVEFKLGKELSKLIGFVNGGSAFDLNNYDKEKGRQVWWNYWDNCIRDEVTFYKRLNYIHHNPVKHGYTNKMEDYKHSTYNYYLTNFSKEHMSDLFSDYPIVDFTDERDNF